MLKTNVIKKSTSVCLVIILSLFTFISCGQNSQEKVVDKFLSEFKSKNFEKSYEYLVQDENKERFVNYINNITNIQNNDESVKNLINIIQDKMFDFTYRIDEVEIVSDTLAKVDVNLNNFDLSDAYEDALQEFLSKSLDFDNLDNLYNSDYIINLLISHINKLKMDEDDLEINLYKEEGKWKIKLDEEMLQVLVGTSIGVFDNLKENIDID